MYRRRRKFVRRWRRGSYHPKRRLWRRYFRRGHHGRRRRTVRRRVVSEWVPGRHKTIWVTGWEPLGNICQGEMATTEAQPYKSLEPQDASGQWHGTWGRHYFTPQNLMLRARAYWNQWSSDWSSYDYIQFLGGYFKIPTTATCPWMINTDEYLQVKLKNYNPNVTEDRWDHPGILINNPKTHMIFPQTIFPRKRMYKIPIRPPPGWKGLERLPDANSFVCVHWMWTYFDPVRAFWDPSWNGTNVHTCQQEPWWGTGKVDAWVDRKSYQSCSSAAQQKSWGPFLPCRYVLWPECSIFFLYKLKFRVVGTSIWRPLPRNTASDGLIPAPPGTGGHHSETEANSKKRTRPQSVYDIWPGDLDAQGILKEEALQRITGDYSRPKRPKLGDTRRLKYLATKLRDVLRQRGLLSE
nr:ORF1 [Torque teno felis virus]